MIETTSIKEMLELKFDFKDKFSREELSEVTDIRIERLDNDQSLLPVNFKEILLFNNLKKLHINNCILDKAVMEIIEISQVQELYLTNCEIIEEIESNLFEMNLEVLIIDNTELKVPSNIVIKVPTLTLANIELPINKIICKELNIAKLEIRNVESFSYITAETIIMSEETYDSYQEVLFNKGVHIKVLNKYNEIVREVN